MSQALAEAPLASSVDASESVRTVDASNTFLSRFWAVLKATIMHPLTTTVVRVME
jgi:hypothetical protein